MHDIKNILKITMENENDKNYKMFIGNENYKSIGGSGRVYIYIFYDIFSGSLDGSGVMLNHRTNYEDNESIIDIVLRFPHQDLPEHLDVSFLIGDDNLVSIVINHTTEPHKSQDHHIYNLTEYEMYEILRINRKLINNRMEMDVINSDIQSMKFLLDMVIEKYNSIENINSKLIKEQPDKKELLQEEMRNILQQK